MKSWLSRLVAAKPSPAPPRPDAAPAPAPAAPGRLDAALLTIGQPGVDLAFFAWMVGGTAEAQAPLGAREHRALQHLARLTADPGAHPSLLPRTAAVVPQLLARLRAESSSLTDLSQQVSRDVTLVAEVVGMANSAYYRRQEAVVGLEQAIRVLGVDGLRSAIARVVLRPLIDTRGGDLVGRSAARLWEHTDRKAQLCAALARSQGLAPFDAYLLGLVHNAAWTAVLRAMDSVEGDSPWCIGTDLVVALRAWRDRLFALIARQWQLPGNLTPVAAELVLRGLAADASPALLHLYAGDRLASLRCDADQQRAAALAEPLLAAAGESVRACYDGFVQPGASGPIP
jgi:HD-like signal output (HDOD) protein